MKKAKIALLALMLALFMFPVCRASASAPADFRLPIMLSNRNTLNPSETDVMIANTNDFAPISAQDSARSENGQNVQPYGENKDASAAVLNQLSDAVIASARAMGTGGIRKAVDISGNKRLDNDTITLRFHSSTFKAGMKITVFHMPEGSAASRVSDERGKIVVAKNTINTPGIVNPGDLIAGGSPKNDDPDDFSRSESNFRAHMNMTLLELLRILDTTVGEADMIDDQALQDFIAKLKEQGIGLADYFSSGIQQNEVGLAFEIEFYTTEDGKVLPGLTFDGKEYHFTGMVVMGDGTMLQFGDPLDLTGDTSQQFGLVQMNQLEEPEYCFFSTVESEALGLKFGGMVRGGDVLVNENGTPMVYHLDEDGMLTGKGAATQEILDKYKAAGYENGIPAEARQNPCALLGHDWGQPETGNGVAARICRRCGESEAAEFNQPEPLSSANMNNAANDPKPNENKRETETGISEENEPDKKEPIMTDDIPPEHVHDFSPTFIPPTCTADGEIIYACACGEWFSVNAGSALGHTQVSDPAVPASCTKAGLTAGAHCSVCNEVLIPQVETGTDPTAHPADRIVIDPAVAATCTQPGKTAGSHCGDCNAVIEAQVEIPTDGHTGGTATCEAQAVCTVCGEPYGDLAAHTPGSRKYSEKEDGYYWRILCTVCHEEIENGFISFDDENFDPLTVEWEDDSEENGGITPEG